MFKTLFLCLTLCAALDAQPHLPSQSGEHKPNNSSVDKLKGDLESIKADGATKPSQASTQKPVNDLTAATADKNLSSREIPQLTNDFHKVLNTDFNAAVSDAQTLLKASGVSSADATPIASDLKAIGAEVRKAPQSAQPGDMHKKFGRK